jgi:hypothetical protein
MKKSIFGGLLLTTCLVACGNGTTTGTDGTGGTETGDSGTGGGTGTGTSGGASAFIGLWTLDEGMATATCNGETSSATFGATITIMAGLTADEITTTSTATGGECVNKFDVSGDTATAEAGSGCTLMYTDTSTGLQATEQRTNSGSFSLNGTILTVNAGGSDTITEGGESEVCTLAGTATYTKASN